MGQDILENSRTVAFRSSNLSVLFLQKENAHHLVCVSFWRYRPDLNWRMRVLQTLALPLGHGTICNEERSRVPHLLEPDFLQCPGLWIRTSLAVASLGAGIVDDSGVSKSGQNCRQYPNSLFGLADLCGLPELGRLVFELKGKRTPKGVRFFMCTSTGQICLHLSSL